MHGGSPARVLGLMDSGSHDPMLMNGFMGAYRNFSQGVKHLHFFIFHYGTFLHSVIYPLLQFLSV